MRVPSTVRPVSRVWISMRQPALRNSHDRVVHGLGSAIVAGTFAEGATLPGEETLLARFAVSRTVLREAFKTLAAKGLVVARTRVGMRVCQRQAWNLFDADVLAWHVVEGVESRLREECVSVASSLIRNVRPGASDSRTRIS